MRFKKFDELNEEVWFRGGTPIGSVTIRIDGDGKVKQWATEAIWKAMKGIQGERHIFVDGEEIKVSGRGSSVPMSGYKSAFQTNEDVNQYDRTSLPNGEEDNKRWNRRTGFNRDLTQELTDVCDRFLRHIDPEDIEQALKELSYKYGDMK